MIRSIRSGKGFTIVEVVVVLAIIGILSVIAMQTFGSIKEKGKLRQVEANINSIELALSSYAQKHNGKYPGLKEYPGSGGGWIAMGPAITGGNGGPLNEPNIFNQDDFLYDMKAPDSPFRMLPGQPPVVINGIRQKMQPIDDLVFEGMYEYPENPFKPDTGEATVNVAYIAYDFEPATNDFVWVTDLFAQGYDGLAPGIPSPGGIHQFRAPWDPTDPATYGNYPAGDFAYIPMAFTDFDGRKAEGYWLIGYGDQSTLVDSPYNKLLQDPDWPNLPPPFDDDDGTLPPVSYELTIRQLMTGALTVKANIYEDQLKGFI